MGENPNALTRCASGCFDDLFGGFLHAVDPVESLVDGFAPKFGASPGEGPRSDDRKIERGEVDAPIGQVAVAKQAKASLQFFCDLVLPKTSPCVMVAEEAEGGDPGFENLAYHAGVLVPQISNEEAKEGVAGFEKPEVDLIKMSVKVSQDEDLYGSGFHSLSHSLFLPDRLESAKVEGRANRPILLLG